MLTKFYRHFLAPRLRFARASVAARSQGLRAFRVLGGNMEPTLRLGEVALYTTEYADGFSHGEVVVVKHPDYYGGDAVPLRIVALGGDVVEIENGRLLVNHQAKPEPYLLGADTESDSSKQFSAASVPGAFAFMLGDCRDNSNDSRFLGSMPLRAIVGKVKMVHPLESPKAQRAVR